MQYHQYGVSVLQLHDGTLYHWKATKRRRSERGFYTADGELVLSCVPRTRWFRFEADMLIEPGQEKCRDLSLLVLLGWYRLRSWKGTQTLWFLPSDFCPVQVSLVTQM